MEAGERPLTPTAGLHASPASSPTSDDAAYHNTLEEQDEEQTLSRNQDADTCRICRGEGSAEEPLFFPCKCSGSIKYVHQDCLMEWLSHSQKKYCELCKTPFHFTKLYSPAMPKQLPTSVFLRKAIWHVLTHLWTWFRGLLVGVVWLMGVPWIMRCVWRVMFWIGDAGWARDSLYMAPLMNAVDAGEVLAIEDISGVWNSTIKIPSLLNITSSTLNMSQDPLVFKLAKGLFSTMIAPLRRTDPLYLQANVTINPMVARMLEQGHSSILSDVHALQNLTSSAFTNRFVMDVLEGQIITLSVVIVCILVFLIREWVVQQQPVVDLGAADAVNALAQAGGGVQPEPNNDPAAENNEEDPPRADDAPAAENMPPPVDITGAPTEPTNASTDLDSEHDEEEEQEKSMERLKVVFQRLSRYKTMLGSLESAPDHDFESLLPNQRARVLNLRRRISELEKAMLRSIQKQNIGRDQMLDAVTWDLKELVAETYLLLDKKLDTNGTAEASDSGLLLPQSTDTACGEPSYTIDAGRDRDGLDRDGDVDMLDAPPEQDEDGHDSNGSWQQVSDSEKQGADQLKELQSNAATDRASEVRDDISWVSTAGSADERAAIEGGLPMNPFAADTRLEDNDVLLNQPVGPAPEAVAPPVGRLVQLFGWLWGDIPPAGQNIIILAGEVHEGEDDERIIEDIANEAPFVPFAGAQHNHGGQHAEPAAPVEPEVRVANPPAPAPAPGGLPMNAADAEAIEDAEDLEGILELIGMQGPIAGLIQNAIFSCILISLSVALCVFAPYVWGKLVLLHIAEPSLFYKVPLKTATMVADLAIDASITLAGYVFYGVVEMYRWAMAMVGVNVSGRESYKIVLDVHKHAKGALDRLLGGFNSTQDFQAGDFLYLSMACHAALYVVEGWAAGEIKFVLDSIKAMFSSLASGNVVLLGRQLKDISLGFAALVFSAGQQIWSIAHGFYATGNIAIAAGTPLIVPDDPMLTYWNARDRALAITAGYTAVAFICCLYVKIAPITSSTRGRRIESYIVEACQQAGGVLKVILIISIEMIAFPLFCGFLLDFALMPLFEHASLATRFAFTLRAPWTSGFVHWFVGTCYMFHFALFVSMCRRILRPGVLYFIRDPDDPTFHPVRDVLERSVITQLRKIAFSAIVYGALIIVCLGGVVWGLWLASNQVLPIHWSSTGSNIELPLDILFYNFLTPFVVHYAKPSAGITKMYEWWFKTVARGLRLSDFMFGFTYADETGHWVRRTWKAFATRRVNYVSSKADAMSDREPGHVEHEDGDVRFEPDGKCVRAPGSDQVRIPKGGPVFVAVDDDNKRLDGKPDEGVHATSSSMFTKVYIPPWFRIRIGIFVVAVWLFAAATGLCVTIVPLLFGRYLLSSTFGPKEAINDIYAFSLGIYILGGLLYAFIHRATIGTWARATFIPTDGGRKMAASSLSAFKRLASLLYVYSTLAIGLPLVNAVLLEVYILMPMHFLFDAGEHHVMHLVQDWTLGILYVRIGMRMFLFNADSRPARAIRQVFARGYLNPDARRATRFFILPAIVGFALLIGVPFAAAVIANKTYFRHMDDSDKIAVMRLAYPLASTTVISAFVGRKIAQATGKWRARIRDEVYLVGERLHNFGERKGSAKGKEKASRVVVA